ETAFTLNVNPISYPDKCGLRQLHCLTRQGSRYLDPPEMLKYDQLEKTFPLQKNRIFQLSKRGGIEPYFDGIQSALRYENNKKDRYNLEVVKFQTGASASMSAIAFYEGIFNGDGPLDAFKNQPVYIWSIPPQDNILEGFRNCRLLNETILKKYSYI
ncbi:17134_t:CDS:2, partial [Racocetra persica]